MTTTQDASLSSRCLLLCMALVLVVLVGSSAALGQIAGTGGGVFGLGAVGTGSGFGNDKSTATDRTRDRPVRRGIQESESAGGEALLSRGQVDKASAEQAIDEARDALARASAKDPSMVSNKAFRDLEESMREAEVAFVGRNFALARQEALLVRQGIADLVPDRDVGVLERPLPGQGPSAIEAAFAQEEVSPEISR
ncbi:MAG TPA: hypothetical protein EYN74_00395, partial [Nitrospirales bacterium]|nr:hypothetical protein [Nitrospirales bacterium]